MPQLAIVGLGEHACTRLLPALARLDDATVVVGVDPDAAARTRAAAVDPSLRTSVDVDAALDPEAMDGVVIAVPPVAAPELAAAAQARGMPVYLEKPGAVRPDDLAVLDSAGTRLMAGFCYRFDPAIDDARAQLASGAIGRVVAARFVFTTSSDATGWRGDPRLGGGVLREVAIHEIDLARWLTGDELQTVTAEVRSRVTADDTIAITASTRGGVLVDLVSAQGAADVATFELIGDEGALTVDRWSAPWVRRKGRSAAGPMRTTMELAQAALGRRGRRAARAARHPGASHERALGVFLELVRGRHPDAPGLSDLTASLCVIEAAERSAVEGRRVVLE